MVIKEPHNKWIERTALGRHALCSRPVISLGSQSKGRAGDATAPGFPAGHLRPCSPLIHTLYGPKIRDRKSEIGDRSKPNMNIWISAFRPW